MRIMQHDRVISDCADAERLLDLVFYTMRPDVRGYLMAEAPGAYRRYCKRNHGTDIRLHTVILDDDEPMPEAGV
ncbi:MAG: hypothetical protein ABIJ75_07220 [Actinomycetota bacterium]